MEQPTNDSGFIATRTIEDRIVALGAEIAKYYAQREGQLLVIGLLKGSFIFLADLVRRIQRPLTVDFIIVQSNNGGKKPKDLGSKHDPLHISYMPPPHNIRGRHVLVVDDIMDSGNTLTQVCQALQRSEPRSVQTCVLLNRVTGAERLVTPGERFQDAGGLPYPRFIGFNITHSAFVVGYGLDRDEELRHLPYIMRVPT